jgi:hypothetical protein
MKIPPYETVLTLGVRRLYRYEPFVNKYLASTLNGHVHFSRTDAVNDPWDCKPWFNTPESPRSGRSSLNGSIRLPKKRSPALMKNCALAKWKSSGQILTPYGK